MNFKYLMIAAAALLMSFASCGNDDATDESVETGTKSVTLKITKAKTYGEDESASGKVPVVADAQVFFIGGGLILERGTMDATEIGTTLLPGTGKTFNNIPAAVSKVVFVGNNGALNLNSPEILPTVTTEAALNEIMLDIEKQTDPVTAVNVYGDAVVPAGTGVGGADLPVAIDVRPAIARIEIAKIAAKTVGVTTELTSFKLTGIFINNTYNKLGLDYTTLPTAPSIDIIAFDDSNLPAFDFGSLLYPAHFKNEWDKTLVGDATSFVPNNLNPLFDQWAYYVMPPVAGKGEQIGTILKSSVPFIIVKIEDAVAVGGVAIPNPAYLTITKLMDAGVALTHLEKGNVYEISEIAIDGADLNPTPIAQSRNVAVNITVQPWVGVPVTPGL